MQQKIDILERALKREKAARKQAEEILESKSADLYEISVQLKQTNEQLKRLYKKEANKLQGVFQNISDAYLVINFEGKVLEMNDAAIKLFGFDIDKENFNVLELLFIKDLDHAYDTFRQLYTNGQFTNYITRIKTKQENIKWVHINTSLVYDEFNNPIAAQGIIRDITESKRAAEIIEDQKKELEIIVENAPFGIALTMGNTIVKTNDTCRQILGYTSEELLTLGVDKITYYNPPEVASYVAQLNQNKIETFEVEKAYLHKDNRVVWAHTTVSALRDVDGDLKVRLVIIKDISSEREKNKSITLINEVAKAILGKVDLYDISWEIVQNIAHYLETEDCVIYLLDKEKGFLNQIAAYGNKAIGKSIANEIIIPYGKGIVGTVAKNGNTRID